MAPSRPCRIFVWPMLLAAVAVAALMGARAGTPAVAHVSRAQPEAGTGRYAKDRAAAQKFMVAAANPLAVRAGLEMLEAGGSALDAAIAVQLVLNLVEPQSSGIGGGAFLLHWDDRGRTLETYDGRETAPRGARPDRFLDQGKRLPFFEAVKSGLSVGVPGLLRMLEMAHRAHGRLDWARLFQPAIRLARAGFVVSPRLNFLLTWAARPEHFAPAARDYFYDAAGVARPVGYRLKNLVFAMTLETIAAGGAAVFYQGEVARSIVAAVKGAPRRAGDLTLEDLAGYEAKTRAPVCVDYRDVQVCGMGPPSSGGLTVAQILKLAERFDLAGDPPRPMNTRALHILGEASRLAYADRNRYMADTDFISMPVGLLDPTYLASRSRRIIPFLVQPRVSFGMPPGADRRPFGQDQTRESKGTSHISIVDGEGNAVSMTTTIESAFGSGLWASGFLLNNELTDFSFRPFDAEGQPIANRVEAGKRPRSSMAPTMLFNRSDGSFRAALGSPGGSRIILYVVKAVVGLVDWKLHPQAVTALANFGHRGRAFEIEYDPSLATDNLFQPWSTVPSVWRGIRLRALGHRMAPELMTSGLHIVERRADGMLVGGADPRREGVALGR
jgi:gamma-glutamyltranspeptidase/glutathione hydrolase